MGQSRTLGAVRSYFSKNRKRLDFDRVADEAQARIGGADGIPMQQVCLQEHARLHPMPVVPTRNVTVIQRAADLVLLVCVKYLCFSMPVAVDADHSALKALSKDTAMLGPYHA